MKAQKLELLAPARDLAVGRTAILAGADAVYIGAPDFGARAAATNSIDDIASLCEYAHKFRVRVYVTMNTILFDDELERARQMVWQLWQAGVDALIVQDMAYLKMHLPPIALHASTQCNIDTPAKAKMLADSGFSQLVLPREFTLDEIKAARDAAGVPVEVFVHGALCVSYSGNCHAGCAAMGRSANRGNCPQMCRLPYDLVDAEGRQLMPRRHYLSLRDMRQIENLQALVDAGASSFKIEGRLKDARYVANVVRAYSQALDGIVAASNGTLSRSSCGSVDCNFVPDLAKTFNRQYTTYFLEGKPGVMASIDTPKWRGEDVGVAGGCYDVRSRSFRAILNSELSNGDGLGFFDKQGNYCGFRLNRVENSTLFPAVPLPELQKGTKIYRNNDKAFGDLLDGFGHLSSRRIAVNIRLRAIDEQRLVFAASDERGCGAEIVVDCDYSEARSPQAEQRAKLMGRLGDTIYSLSALDDSLDERFVPSSVLARGRRELLAMLDVSAQSAYRRDRRKPATESSNAFAGQRLDYHSNVANHLAKEFYTEHGAEVSEPAMEVKSVSKKEVMVMQTRYCLRRELGCCLKEKGASNLPQPLFLRNESGLYRLHFDCSRCGMDIFRCRI